MCAQGAVPPLLVHGVARFGVRPAARAPTPPSQQLGVGQPRLLFTTPGEACWQKQPRHTANCVKLRETAARQAPTAELNHLGGAGLLDVGLLSWGSPRGAKAAETDK